MQATDDSPAIEPHTTENESLNCAPIQPRRAISGLSMPASAITRDSWSKARHDQHRLLDANRGSGGRRLHVDLHSGSPQSRGGKASFAAFRDDPQRIAGLSKKKAGGSRTVKDGVKPVFLKAADYWPIR